MRRLLLIQFALRELLIPLLVCLVGIAWGTILILSHDLAYWHLPLLAGMLMTPLVAIGGKGEPPPESPELEAARRELEQEVEAP